MRVLKHTYILYPPPLDTKSDFSTQYLSLGTCIFKIYVQVKFYFLHMYCEFISALLIKESCWQVTNVLHKFCFRLIYFKQTPPSNSQLFELHSRPQICLGLNSTHRSRQYIEHCGLHPAPDSSDTEP